MPRIRTIKPEFWDSPSVASASPWARLLFIAMWNWADDHGRGTANLKELEGFAFPNDAAFTDRSGNTVHFRALVAEVADAFGVVFYTVRGRPYYEIPSWDDHQRNERRSKESKHPSPQVEGAVAEIPCKRTETPHTSGTGTGEQGNRGTGEPPLVPAEPHQRAGESKAVARMNALNATSRTGPGNDVARSYDAWAGGGIDTKTQIEVAQEVDALLADGIDAHQIAEGIKAWHHSDSWSPTQIRRFVAKAARPAAEPPGGKPTKATLRAVDTIATAEALIAEFHQETA